VSIPAGGVNEGTETFTILSATKAIGSAGTGSVVIDTVSASYPVPAGISVGAYTIQAVDNGAVDLVGSADTRHSPLTVNPGAAYQRVFGRPPTDAVAGASEDGLRGISLFSRLARSS
jgi:hypothetical protein